MVPPAVDRGEPLSSEIPVAIHERSFALSSTLAPGDRAAADSLHRCYSPARATIGSRALAHHAQKQGRFARYLGLRKNLLDSRRHAAIFNLEVLHARQAA
jgi:hypothetical protein